MEHQTTRLLRGIRPALPVYLLLYRYYLYKEPAGSLLQRIPGSDYLF
ncbi:hypothetical protein [Paraflavitalea speifideaquila]|nr:hypothetical protein [Paraflavitalea speifideiaquila]